MMTLFFNIKEEESNIILRTEAVLEAAAADKHKNFGTWGETS